MGGGSTETTILAWDPLYKESSIILSSSNKTMTATSGVWDHVLGTVSKRAPVPNPTGYGPWWYFEVTVTSTNTLIGICEESETISTIPQLGYTVGSVSPTKSCGLYSTGAFYRDNTNPLNATAGFTVGDVVGCSYSVGDSTTRVRYYKNGVAISTDMLGLFFGGNIRPVVGVVSAVATISNNLYTTIDNKLGL